MERAHDIPGAVPEAASRMESLYRAHVGWALRLAYLLTGDQQIAEDVVQEAFVKLLARFQDRRHPDRFDAYLRKTIVNLCRDRGRRLSVERRWLATTGSQRPRALEDPDVVEAEGLRKALSELPARQRAALVLRYFEDLSEEQAADALDCSVAAAKSLTARVVAAMRKQLGDGI
jgi:RNA polymerase sigma factor (sigma-70 family)